MLDKITLNKESISALTLWENKFPRSIQQGLKLKKLIETL